MNKEELQEVIEPHRLWLDSEESGKRADLTGADLTGADLTDADLTDADLCWVYLTGTILEEKGGA